MYYMKKRTPWAILFLILVFICFGAGPAGAETGDDDTFYEEPLPVYIYYLNTEPAVWLYAITDDFVFVDGRFLDDGTSFINHIRYGQDFESDGAPSAYMPVEEFLEFIRNAYSSIKKLNVNVTFHDWNPDKAKSIYYSKIHGILENFFIKLPMIVIRSSSMSLINVIQKNIGQELWFETQYSRRKNAQSDGSEVLSFSLGAEVFSTMARRTGTRIMSFLNYEFLQDKDFRDELPPYYVYKYKIQNFNVVRLGLYARSNVTKAFYLDQAIYLGLNGYTGTGSIQFISPVSVLPSQGNKFSGIERKPEEIKMLDEEELKQSIYETTITSWGQGKNARMWALDRNLVFGLGYNFELPGGIMAAPNLYANFLHITHRSENADSTKHFESVKMLDIVPGLDLNFNLAGLVDIRLYFRYVKPLLHYAPTVDSLELGIDFISMDGFYTASIRYSAQDRKNNNLGISMGYRF
jgi:hypothetical protein